MSIIWPMDQVDIPQSCLDSAEAAHPGSVGIAGVRADGACYILDNCPYMLGRDYSGIADQCPPPIPEERPGAMTIAKYIYTLGTGGGL